MFTKEDKEFLEDPAFSMALEKFYNQTYYKEKNGRNATVTQAYAFSNEMLHHMFKHLRKKNPKVLTVGSSGDQLLYSLYYGSKDITLIDVNLYSQYWIEYKMAAIKNLSFEEFNEYFLQDCQESEHNPFDNKILTRIFQDLSEKSKVFWGNLALNGHTPQEIYSGILSRSDSSLDRIYSIFYKDKTAYSKLQKIIAQEDFKINYINEEFSKFHETVDGKFDIILLSNIRRYVGDVAYLINVKNLYKKHLNKGGIMQLHYEYFNPKGRLYPKFKTLFPDLPIKGYGFKNHHYTYLLQKPLNYKEEKENQEMGEI